MGRPKSPYGYTKSRYNRLSHGVEFHGILPSRGIEACYHAEGCRIAEDEKLRHLCVAGEACPHETWIHAKYTASARTTFAHCRAWLADQEFERLIYELSVAELEYMRLHVLINREGLLREKRHPVSGYPIGEQMGLGVGRYSTAIDRRFDAAFAALQVIIKEDARR